MRRGFGGLPRAAVAVVEGALLVAPGGALGRVDLPVVIGVDAVEAFVEPAVAVSFGEAGEPVVIGLHLFESGLLPRREIGGGELAREVALPPLDEGEPPIAVLPEGDRVAAGADGSGRLGGLARQR